MGPSPDRRTRPSRSPQARRPKVLAKACVMCRAKKIRCDAVQPRCSACVSQDRECVYRIEAPRKRPTFSRIHELQQQKAALESLIVRLSRCSQEERGSILATVVDEDGQVRLSEEVAGHPEAVEQSARQDIMSEVSRKSPQKQILQRQHSTEPTIVSSEDEMDIAHFISVDEAGKPSSFGPSSALHNPTKSEAATSPSSGRRATLDHARNSLIANAALQRQMEHNIFKIESIDGTPISLAMHLLNLHWQRQHHSFLLTYRPAIMRDLQCGGPNCSIFLLNAIFACASKFSTHLEVRDDVNDASTAGKRFFRRCDQLLAQESLLIRPQITTVIGLLLLGSTFNARGETSKGWLYTGYALRMVYDLGLHLDPEKTLENPEDIEIRRRVFWGAFVCDKLQSLYLGRPVAINLRDSQVSRDFLDLYEERELFIPPPDSRVPPPPNLSTGDQAVPLHSTSAFQQLCLLSKIMTTIINRFYVVGATFSNAQNSLQQVDNALQHWKENLSPELDFQPWLSGESSIVPSHQPPNVMILHNLYYSLIILVHRPFISDGHLRSADPPVRSWESCTAAARYITSISLAYKSAFGLSSAPYVLGYTIYVACTIHVRNAAARDQHSSEHLSMLVASLNCLDELCLANPGVAKPASIIRRLMEVNQLETSMGMVPQLRQDVEAEEMPTVEQTAASFDLDAILNMFPMGNWAAGEFEGGFRPSMDAELPDDPLFGLMEMPSLDFTSPDKTGE